MAGARGSRELGDLIARDVSGEERDVAFGLERARFEGNDSPVEPASGSVERHHRACALAPDDERSTRRVALEDHRRVELARNRRPQSLGVERAVRRPVDDEGDGGRRGRRRGGPDLLRGGGRGQRKDRQGYGEDCGA